MKLHIIDNIKINMIKIINKLSYSIDYFDFDDIPDIPCILHLITELPMMDQ